MMMGGVVVRRLIGALIVFAATVSYRADDLSHLWRSGAPADSGRAAAATKEPRQKDRPAESAQEPAETPAAEPNAAVRRSDPAADRSRKNVPPDFIRNPLSFLSRAPSDSLVLLPGIGPVIAERIIDARTGKRSFTKWEDLLAIKGIGPKTLDRLRTLAGAAKP
jgi:competence protein ComEA